MKMSAFTLAAGLVVAGALGSVEAQAAPAAAQQVRYDPYYGGGYYGGYGGYDRRDRWDRRRDRQQRRWNRNHRGYGYGYGNGYGYAPRCWVEYRYGRRVRVCG